MRLTKRGRAALATVREAAAKHGLEVSRVGMSRHPYAILTYGDHEQKFSYSGTPSDHRTCKNIERDIKRVAEKIRERK